MIATPEKSLSPAKQTLVDRVKTRRRSMTPFPTDVSNPIIARVLTEKTEHPSLGRVTRASEKRRKEESKGEREKGRRVYTYDEQQEKLPQEDNNDEWMDPEGFCHKYNVVE